AIQLALDVTDNLRLAACDSDRRGRLRHARARQYNRRFLSRGKPCGENRRRMRAVLKKQRIDENRERRPRCHQNPDEFARMPANRARQPASAAVKVKHWIAAASTHFSSPVMRPP